MIYIQLLESMSLIGIAAYLYSQTKTFNKFLKNKSDYKYKLIIITFFSVLSMLGTYTGVNIEPYALANARPIGAIVAGYIGGPLVGLIVGIIAGTHRYFLGGFTALSCAISTIIEGIVGGIANVITKDKSLDVSTGIITAIIAEVLQVIIILLIAKPYENALQLERVIALPMIITNSIGVGIFINIINNTQEHYKKIGAIQSQKALNIAKKTSIYLRSGFNQEISDKVCSIIYEAINLESIFIAQNDSIFSYNGEELNKEKLKYKIKEYFNFKDYRLIKFEDNNKEKLFYCVPIYTDKNKFKFVIGIQIKSYKSVDKYFSDFAKELSALLATQIELYELEQLTQEVSKAELKMLRNQIHPHFLFNTLNTIASFCRTDSIKARELILNLSNYFRQTLKRQDEKIILKEEIEFLESYLAIEKARFGERLNVDINIPEELLDVKVPVFVLQPIIENSMRHGILIKPQGGVVTITAIDEKDKIKFVIKDTGVGMDENTLNYVVKNWPGIGLSNVNKRLKLLYGEKNFIHIKSKLNEGTKVMFYIPKEVF
ncbi:sensor histidine kinase [Clostridium sporogenes]|uniref:Sensor histidine kinase n=1 Tax=Clostridium sporogenes TaxID=1509 RepID=A0A7U4JRU4_CLOSG|nr:LytS/YhcK type 5TM receptor domain-containing protein [Clostridium sporogenes]AKC64120.1 sensor histidine kinase [Clostridium sporogenes]AKJ91258.1 histidine kinase [Clostridium sporogenes]KCZ66608.1 sensor histidine kinase [Clostridium sporogenes]OOO66870.1 histidine kinase [Clostridium sporogenes]SQB89361.1 sensor histidine kinase [Clostridium sporogenes]